MAICRSMGVWEVVSNVFYVPVIVRAFQLGAIAEGVLLVLVTLASLAWHSCNTWQFCWGVSGGVVGRLDTFVTKLVFLLLGIYLIAVDRPQFKLTAYIGAVVLLYALTLTNTSTAGLAVSFATLLLALLLMRVLAFGYPHAKLDPVDLTAAIVLTVTSLLLFGLANNETAAHGFWHLTTAAAAFFALEALDRRRSLIWWKRKPHTAETEGGAENTLVVTQSKSWRTDGQYSTPF